MSDPAVSSSSSSTSGSLPAEESSAAFDRWRSSLSQFTGLGLTDDEKVERDRLKENGVLERDWDRCEKWKKDLMTNSELETAVMTCVHL
jgi:inner membrane protease ATP23